MYLGRPLRRCFRGQPSIPILMYHSIADEDESRVHPYFRTATSPSVFELHMGYLAEHGYRVISLPEAAKQLQEGFSEGKYAVITFDDGYANFYHNAFPVLHRYDFTATVFIPTAYAGLQAVQFNGKDCLTWSEIRELHRHRIYFGSHTVTHPQLASLGTSAVKSEIQNSKEALEDNLGEGVDSFAYPYAFPEEDSSFVDFLRGTLMDAGYCQGVSTRIGRAHVHEDRYFLRRLPMNSLDDRVLFVAKLQGAYDWLHTVQFTSKWIRRKRLI